jgi:multiple sugar transport system substrate-binding protein
MNHLNFSRLIIVLASGLLGLTACSGQTAQPSSAASNPAPESAARPQASSPADMSPVTLTFYNLSQTTEDEFNQTIAAPVNRKFPNVTLKFLADSKSSKLADLVATGEIPDIVYYANGNLSTVYQLKLFMDMQPLVKKYQVDLNKFDPALLKSVQSLSDKGELFGFPDNIKLNSLLYNKDIFDKFGIPYPKDGMNWSETLDLAKKATRTDGGVQYRGFDFKHGYLANVNQLSLPLIDKATGKAKVNTDGWKLWMTTMKSFYDIDGNQLTKDLMNKDWDLFFKDKVLAMDESQGIFNMLPDAEVNGLNWDMVTTPFFTQEPHGGIPPFHLIQVTQAGKNPDMAFQVANYIVSDEIQTVRTRSGNMTSLNNPQIRKQFGLDLDVLKGKNIAAFFKNEITRPVELHPDDSLARNSIVISFRDYAQGLKDVNTALRDAEESANQKIAENGR